MEAKSPEQLHVYNAFGKKPGERRAKWRWLGYALSGTHISPSSIRHVRIEDEWLSLDDVTSFLGRDALSPNAAAVYRTPWAGTKAGKRYVRLATDATVLLFNRRWQSLSDLGMTEANSFVVLDDSEGDELIAICVPGFGTSHAKCASVIDAFALPPPSSRPFKLLLLHCGINKCEVQALRLLATSIGHSLVRLSVCLNVGITFTQPDAVQFVSSLPALEFLDLTNVSLGSMDVLLSAYETGALRVAVLSMTNSFVEPASMTRFACHLQDPSRQVSQHLREFRYIFEDSVDGACPQIITRKGAAAFTSALANNAVLSFLDVGLVGPVFDQFAAQLQAFDSINLVEAMMESKLASMSVESREGNRQKKKQPRQSLPVLPVERRRDLATHIWSFFVQCPVSRVVSVISVPRK